MQLTAACDSTCIRKRFHLEGCSHSVDKGHRRVCLQGMSQNHTTTASLSKSPAEVWTCKRHVVCTFSWCFNWLVMTCMAPDDSAAEKVIGMLETLHNGEMLTNLWLAGMSDPAQGMPARRPLLLDCEWAHPVNMPLQDAHTWNRRCK